MSNDNNRNSPRLVPADLLRHAREMRHDPAPAEAILWQCLRNRQLGGFKFRRQNPVPPFIADFHCLQVNLVVELDGDSHDRRAAYDASRTTRLNRDGHHVLRFVNTDVFEHTDSILEEILGECERLATRKTPSP